MEKQSISNVLLPKGARFILHHRSQLKKESVVNISGQLAHLSEVIKVKDTKLFLAKLDGEINILVKKTSHLHWQESLSLNQQYVFTGLVPTSLRQGGQEQHPLFAVTEKSEIHKLEDVNIATITAKSWIIKFAQLKSINRKENPTELDQSIIDEGKHNMLSYQGEITAILDSGLGVYELDHSVRLYVGQVPAVHKFAMLQVGSTVLVQNAHHRINTKHSQMSMYCCMMTSVQVISGKQKQTEPISRSQTLLKLLYQHSLTQSQLDYLYELRGKLRTQFHSSHGHRVVEKVLTTLLKDPSVAQHIGKLEPRNFLDEFLSFPHECGLVDTENEIPFNFDCVEDILQYCSMDDRTKPMTDWSCQHKASQQMVLGTLETCRNSGHLCIADGTGSVNIVMCCNHSYRGDDSLECVQGRQLRTELRSCDESSGLTGNISEKCVNNNRENLKIESSSEFTAPLGTDRSLKKNSGQCSENCVCGPLKPGESFPCTYVHSCCLGKIVLVKTVHVVLEQCEITDKFKNQSVSTEQRTSGENRMKTKCYLFVDLRNVVYLYHRETKLLMRKEKSEISDGNREDLYDVKNKDNQNSVKEIEVIDVDVERDADKLLVKCIVDSGCDNNASLDEKHSMKFGKDSVSTSYKVSKPKYIQMTSEKEDISGDVTNYSNNTSANGRHAKRRKLDNSDKPENNLQNNATVGPKQNMASGGPEQSMAAGEPDGPEQKREPKQTISCKENEGCLSRKISEKKDIKDVRQVCELREVKIFVENKGSVIVDKGISGGKTCSQFFVEADLLIGERVFKVCLSFSDELVKYYQVVSPGMFYKLMLHAGLSPLLCMSNSNIRVQKAAIKSKTRILLTVHQQCQLCEMWGAPSVATHRITALPLLLQPEFLGAFVSFEGLIVKRHYTKPDEDGPVAVTGQCARILVQDVNAEHHKIWVYINERDIQCPLGLIPGASVMFNSLERKVAKTGNVYCRFVAFSSVRILCFEDPQSMNTTRHSSTFTAGGKTIPIMHLANLWTLANTATFHCMCDIQKVSKLTLKCTCITCGSLLVKGSCSDKGCDGGEAYRFTARASIVVDDGTSVAMVTLTGSSVQSMLKLSHEQWNSLEQEVSQCGEVFFQQIRPCLNTPLERFIYQLCDSEDIKLTWDMTLKSLPFLQDIHKMNANEFSCKEVNLGSTRVTTHCLPFPQLECLHLTKFDPEQWLIQNM